MSSFEIHLKKHELFKKDAENTENSHPTRIEALFESCFHMIEACTALNNLHINKHQMLRQILEENDYVFGKDTKEIWSNFQEIENKIRPGQAYGGKINGEQLQKAQGASENIFGICNRVIAVFRKKNLTKEAEKEFSQEKSNENAEGI